MTARLETREFASVFVYHLFIQRQRIGARKYLQALVADTRKELGLEDQ